MCVVSLPRPPAPLHAPPPLLSQRQPPLLRRRRQLLSSGRRDRVSALVCRAFLTCSSRWASAGPSLLFARVGGLGACGACGGCVAGAWPYPSVASPPPPVRDPHRTKNFRVRKALTRRHLDARVTRRRTDVCIDYRVRCPANAKPKSGMAPQSQRQKGAVQINPRLTKTKRKKSRKKESGTAHGARRGYLIY